MSNNKQIKKAVSQSEAGKKGAEVKKPKRQIIIETDGDNINIVKAEVAGQLELVAILNSLLQFLARPKQ